MTQLTLNIYLYKFQIIILLFCNFGYSKAYYNQDRSKENSSWNATNIGTKTNASYINFKLTSEAVSAIFAKEYDPLLPSTDEFSIKSSYHRDNYDQIDGSNSTDIIENFFDEEENESRNSGNDYENKNETFIIEDISSYDDNINLIKSEIKKKKKLEEKNQKRQLKNKQNKLENKNANSKTEPKATPNSSKVDTKRKSNSKFRLPTSVVPVHYVLRLHPRFDKDFLVTGSVEIEVEVREATSRIKLHSSHINVNKTSVQVNLLKAHKKVPIKSIKLNPKRQFMSIKLSRKLKPGRVYVLTMKFSYYLNEESKGFYKIDYSEAQGQKSWLAATQFWPSDARKAFPCFDEPGMKATFDVHLARSSNMKSLTNMPLVRNYRIKGKPEWVWDQFATSANMSTYLVAFSVANFTFSTHDESDSIGAHLKVWTRKSMANKTSLALNVGISSIQFFEKYFDSKFPLPKIDMIALPKLSFGGMENWGLITYRESSLLFDESTSSVDTSLSISYLVAHEIAHQWFGNLVTFEWWNDLWLNEGFATYMSFLAVDDIKPSWNIQDQFVVTRLQEVMATDALPSSHAVSSPVKDPSRINEIFDAIPYDKGASLIRMMKHFLSEATFRKGIQLYLQHFKYKNTRQDDLWYFMTKAALKDKSLPTGLTVKGIMDTWTLQKGYPYLQVQRHNNGTAFLTQKPFLLGRHPTQKKKEKSVKWWIPITFTTQERPSFKHTRAQTWLREGDDSLQVTGLPPQNKWVIFNLQQTGYYRVNYDEITWSLLINQLNTDHEVIYITNRAQLIDDALNFARAGLLSYNLALQLVSYLKFEKEYIPWKAGLRNLYYIKDMMQKSKGYGFFKSFVLDLLSLLINSVDSDTSTENDAIQKKLLIAEVISWLCQMEHNVCMAKVQKLTEVVNSNVEELTELKLSDPVLCSSVRNGNEEFWEKIFTAFQNSKFADEKSKYLRALGCTNYVWLLNRYLHLMQDNDSGVLRQEGVQLYKAATQLPIGVYAAWDTFRTSWKNLKEFSDFTDFVAPEIIKTITDTFNTHHQLKELQLFKEQIKDEISNPGPNDHKSVNSVLPALNTAIAKTEVNLKWMKTNQRDIIQWFTQYKYSSRPLVKERRKRYYIARMSNRNL